MQHDSSHSSPMPQRSVSPSHDHSSNLRHTANHAQYHMSLGETNIRNFDNKCDYSGKAWKKNASAEDVEEIDDAEASIASDEQPDEVDAMAPKKSSKGKDVSFEHSEESSRTGSSQGPETKKQHDERELEQQERAAESSMMQFYRFMKHEDLKAKIQDLCKREQSAVTKQSWDEALRLREMRNEFILLKNRNLYGNDDLDIEQDVKQSALKNIEARRAMHEKREKMINYSMYSDEAKDLWKQWVKEDEHLAQVDPEASLDMFLKKIEEDWKNLALRDKERISELYDRMMNHSDLQDEHQLATAFQAANARQKVYSACFEN